MIADQNFYDICFTYFILPLRLRSTAEGRIFSGTATAEGENLAYGPTLPLWLSETKKTGYKMHLRGVQVS